MAWTLRPFGTARDRGSWKGRSVARGRGIKLWHYLSKLSCEIIWTQLELWLPGTRTSGLSAFNGLCHLQLKVRLAPCEQVSFARCSPSQSWKRNLLSLCRTAFGSWGHKAMRCTTALPVTSQSKAISRQWAAMAMLCRIPKQKPNQRQREQEHYFDMICKAAFCIFRFAVDTEDAMESRENDPNFKLRRLTRRQRPKLKGSLLRKDVDSRVFIYLFDICIPQSQVVVNVEQIQSFETALQRRCWSNKLGLQETACN